MLVYNFFAEYYGFLRPKYFFSESFILEASPRGPIPYPFLTLLYTIFHEKSNPFVYLLLTNGTHFTYLV